MKIGLIAPQDNGKTSYLVALYAVLVQSLSIEGDYPLRFSVRDPSQERWLDDRFTNLVDEDLPLKNEEDPERQRFPRKTSDDVTNYVLQVTGRKSGFSQEISLIDFPGEAMRGMSEGQFDIHEAMVDELTSCDAFIVLLDAAALLSRKAWTAKSRLNPAKIQKIINDAMGLAPYRKFSKIGVPIAFCMSMADRVASLLTQDEDAHDTGYQRIVELFPDFFNPAHQHPVMITAVSLGETIEESPAGAPGLGGPFEPFLIEKPFEFCLAFGALSAMTNAHHDEGDWNDTADVYDAGRRRAANADPFDTVREWFRSGASIGQTPEDRWAERRKAAQNLARASRNEANKFAGIVSIFIDQLRNPENADRYSIFLGGREQELTTEVEAGELPLRPVR